MNTSDNRRSRCNDIGLLRHGNVTRWSDVLAGVATLMHGRSLEPCIHSGGCSTGAIETEAIAVVA